MVRTRIAPELRKARLLESANNLFCQQGYASTTVTDIANAAGVTKTTFFYYYPSKEAILLELVDTWAKEVTREFKTQYAGLPPIKRLEAFIHTLSCTYQQTPLLDTVFNDSPGALSLSVITQSFDKYFNPILEDLCKQGSAEGVMYIEDIPTAIHFFWSLMDTMTEPYNSEDPTKALQEHQATGQSLLETLLGLPRGSLHLHLAEPIK